MDDDQDLFEFSGIYLEFIGIYWNFLGFILNLLELFGFSGFINFFGIFWYL
jgi:hypothetical protein